MYYTLSCTKAKLTELYELARSSTCTWNYVIFILKNLEVLYFRVIYPVYSRIDEGNLVLWHSIFNFPLEFKTSHTLCPCATTGLTKRWQHQHTTLTQISTLVWGLISMIILEYYIISHRYLHTCETDYLLMLSRLKI